MPENIKKQMSVSNTCQKSIEYKTPINVNTSEKNKNYKFKYFTCDKNGGQSAYDYVTPAGGYIYKFNNDAECSYSNNILDSNSEDIINEDKIKWEKWFTATKSFDDCKNFTFTSNENGITIPKSENYLKDLKNAGLLSDGEKDAKPFNFTCRKNGGSYYGTPWERYKYIENGTYSLAKDSKWFGDNVAHLSDCDGLKFVDDRFTSKSKKMM